MGGVKSLDDIYNEIKKDLYEKITIPYMDFSITTKCSLKCRDCTQWLPYIKEKNIYSIDDIYRWLNDMFSLIDYCIFLTILGGEPFLHPDFKEILERFISLKKEKKIGYLRIVTNGTILISDDIIETCSNNEVFLVISDYSIVFDKNKIKKRNKLIERLDLHGCKYFFAKDAEWTDLGTLGEKNNYTKEELDKVFETCFVHDCAGFFEGKLYRCPRCFVIEKNNVDHLKKNEVIDFTLTKTVEKINQEIRAFYGLTSLSACNYCLAPQNRKRIKAASQLE